jgi:hypothetical protein
MANDERDRDIGTLHLQGHSLRSIALQFNMTEDEVHLAVEHFMELREAERPQNAINLALQAREARRREEANPSRNSKLLTQFRMSAMTWC